MVFMAVSFHKLILAFLTTPPRHSTGTVPSVVVRPLDSVLPLVIVAAIALVPIPVAVVVAAVPVIEFVVEALVLAVQPAVETLVFTPGVRVFMKFLVQG